MSEAFRARLDSDFELEIGPDRKKVTVPRLLWKDSTDVIQIIGHATGEDKALAFQMLAEAKKFEDPRDTKAGSALASAARKVIPKMMMQNNHEIVEQILDKLTYGRITKADLATMQVEEVVGIATHLLDGNFASLGPWWASLNRMSSSVKTNG
jgi:hypothetical protein